MDLKKKEDRKAVMGSYICFELECLEPSKGYIPIDDVWFCNKHSCEWLGVRRFD